MFSLLRAAGGAAVVGASITALIVACSANGPASPEPPDPALAAQGKDIFRFDTFGDETFWTDTLRMHEVIQAAVDPTTALAVGPQGGRRRAARRGGAGHPERRDQPHRSRRRRSRCSSSTPSSASRAPSRPSAASDTLIARRHHLRAVPFDGRQLLRAGHRLAAGRLAQPRPQSRGHHRALARAAPRDRRRSTTRGARASTTRASTSTARTARRSSRRPTACSA